MSGIMPVPLPICCYWDECGTTRQYRVDPCSEGVAITIAPVQLNWIWPNLGGQIYGFLRKYHPLPQLWLLVQKRWNAAGFSEKIPILLHPSEKYVFSELGRPCLSHWGHLLPVHVDYLTSLSSRWQLSVWKLCLFLACWCFFLTFTSLKPSTESLSSSPSLIRVSGCCQVLSFTWTLLQLLLITKKDIIK